MSSSSSSSATFRVRIRKQCTAFAASSVPARVLDSSRSAAISRTHLEACCSNLIGWCCAMRSASLPVLRCPRVARHKGEIKPCMSASRRLCFSPASPSEQSSRADPSFSSVSSCTPHHLCLVSVKPPPAGRVPAQHRATTLMHFATFSPEWSSSCAEPYFGSALRRTEVRRWLVVSCVIGSEHHETKCN